MSERVSDDYPRLLAKTETRDVIVDAVTELLELRTENARLRLLEPYVQHLPGCAIHKPYSEMEGEEPNQCDCGFDKLKGG